MSVFKIDGVEYPGIYVTNLTRSFSVLDGPNTGRLLSGEMVRDLVGTYYNYKMDVSNQYSDVEQYDKLYEVISSPVESHTLTVPYAQSELTFQAYITSGEDSLHEIDGVKHWSGLSMSFVAMSPKRRPSK